MPKEWITSRCRLNHRAFAYLPLRRPEPGSYPDTLHFRTRFAFALLIGPYRTLHKYPKENHIFKGKDTRYCYFPFARLSPDRPLWCWLKGLQTYPVQKEHEPLMEAHFKVSADLGFSPVIQHLVFHSVFSHLGIKIIMLLWLSINYGQCDSKYPVLYPFQRLLNSALMFSRAAGYSLCKIHSFVSLLKLFLTKILLLKCTCPE